MTNEEARERFGAAYDGTLEREERGAFERALAADADLAADWARYQRTMQVVQQLDTQTPTPDVLSGVQDKLRRRSGGRFYRDRFSRRAGLGPNLPVVLAAALLVLLAIGWWGLWSMASH